MDIINVGKSELPGRTFGVMQTMERGAGLQAIGFMNEVQTRTGYRLTVNEGRRTRADQRLVWNAYALFLSGRGPWAPKAAQCYNSIHDEINHGNAVDFGGPGGAVVPAAVHAVMVQVGPTYGFVWTGANFNEWWHFEVSRAAAHYQVPEGTVRIGSAPAGSAVIKHEEGVVDVNTIIITDAKGNIWVCDIGQHTKWNIIRGLKTVADAMTRLGDYRAMGVKFQEGKQPNRFVGGLDDITYINYSKAA